MSEEGTRREFIRKYGSVGALAGFSSSANARRSGQPPKRSRLSQRNRVPSQGLSVEFGAYRVVVDGDEYSRIVLHFWDDQTETLAGEFQGTTEVSHRGYRGEGDVIPVDISEGIDFETLPSSPPADETYDEFHGPITHVSVESGDSTEEFPRPNPPESVYDVEFGCSTVSFDYPTGLTDIDILLIYGDGSYQWYREFGGLAYQPLGNTALSEQSLERLYIQYRLDGATYEFANPDADCSPGGSRVATFDCDEVTVASGLYPADALQFFPSVSIVFDDGTSQEVSPGDAYPMTFSGSGEHANKPIEAFRTYDSAWGGIISHIVNPDVESCSNGGTQTFEVLPTDEDVEFSYRFRVDGDVTKGEYRDNRADPEEAVQPHDDGTVTVTGETGDLEGDVFAIDGTILEFEKTGGRSGMRLLLDGEDVTEELTGNRDEAGSARTLLEIVSTEEGEYRYEVVVRGDVEKTRVSENIASQNNDEIEQRDDGTVVIHGLTGNPGYGDAYRIDGDIVEFEHVGGDADAVIRVDGDDVPIEELGGSGDSDSDSQDDPDPSVFAVISTEEGEVSYRIVVRGTVEKTRISETVASQDNDEIRERDDGLVVVDGYTGNPGYGDAFEVTGTIVSVERTGGDADVRLELDGVDVTDRYLADG